jgi:hypothetical protein
MLDQCVLNLNRDGVLRFISEHPKFRESVIVADAYDINTPSTWVAPIFHQV